MNTGARPPRQQVRQEKEETMKLCKKPAYREQDKTQGGRRKSGENNPGVPPGEERMSPAPSLPSTTALPGERQSHRRGTAALESTGKPA